MMVRYIDSFPIHSQPSGGKGRFAKECMMVVRHLHTCFTHSEERRRIDLNKGIFGGKICGDGPIYGHVPDIFSLIPE